jgi:hypothetical protein
MITITDTELEKALKLLLQQQVEFYIHKKTWRSGKLLLFKQNGFYIEFTLRNDKDKNERFEVPIPFNIITKPHSIKFSYELSSLVCNNIRLIENIRKIQPVCKSKYYDSSLEIRTL